MLVQSSADAAQILTAYYVESVAIIGQCKILIKIMNALMILMSQHLWIDQFLK